MLLEELIQRLDKNDQTKDNVYVEDLQELLRYEFGICMNLDDQNIIYYFFKKYSKKDLIQVF